MQICVYKIGHDKNNIYHTTEFGIFKNILSNNADENLSEFNAINQIIKDKSDLILPYDYVGVCTYRTLFLNNTPETVNSVSEYQKLLFDSQELIIKSIEDGYIGLRSSTFPQKFPNRISRARWTGTKSLEYLRKAIWEIRPEWITYFDNYLNSKDNSYRTINVLPIGLFLDCFETANELGKLCTRYRIEDNNLYARSVGYELETFVSFYLAELCKDVELLSVNHRIINFSL